MSPILLDGQGSNAWSANVELHDSNWYMLSTQLSSYIMTSTYEEYPGIPWAHLASDIAGDGLVALHEPHAVAVSAIALTPSFFLTLPPFTRKGMLILSMSNTHAIVRCA
jgi:hypothetical protein